MCPIMTEIRLIIATFPKLKIYSNGKFISANMKLSTAIDSIYLFPSQVFGDLKALDFSGLKFTKADIYIGSLTQK